MSLIINADDFGKSEEINRAIAECFAKGLIQRTTLMVNMPAADAAVALSKEKGFADRVGIHLNLTEGEPLTVELKNNPLLCDTRGFYHAGFHKTLKYRLYMDALTINQIRREFEAQFEKYKAYGLTLWHVDSHHHVHTNYPVLRALKPLASKYEFRSIRLGRNLYHGGNLLMRLYKSLYNHALKRLCNTTTDYFGSFKDCDTYFLSDSAAVMKFVQNKELEIMVHPMYDSDGVLVDTEVPMEKEKELLHGQSET